MPLLGFNAALDPAAVAAEEAAIVAAEGPFHVGGWYIRDPILCERQRRLVAELRVETAHRRAAYLARHAAPDAAHDDAAHRDAA